MRIKGITSKLKGCFTAKRLIVFVLLLVISFQSPTQLLSKYHPKNPCVMVLSYQVGSNTYRVDGEPKGPMDVAPEIKHSRMFLVIRYITSEIEGTMMMWDSINRRVTIVLPSGIRLNLWIGNPQVEVEQPDGTISKKWIDEENHELAPYIKDPGYTMLPMRFVAEYLGADNIFWHSDSMTVDLEFVDYDCLFNTKSLMGRVEETTDLTDGTALIIFTDSDGEAHTFYSRVDLKGEGFEQTLLDYTGFANLKIQDDWIFSWSPIPDHEPFGILKNIEFKQLDLILDATVHRNSNWGKVELTHHGYDGILYFNLMINNNWVIKNRAVLNHVKNGDDQLLHFTIDLGSNPGERIENIEYSASLKPEISAEKPKLTFTSEVGRGRISMMGGLDDFSGHQISSVPIKSPDPPGVQGSGKTEKNCSHKDFPNQQCGDKECTPTTISNSLQFLKKKNFHLKLSEEQTSIDQMKTATSWSSSNFGVPVQTWWVGKKKFMDRNEFRIITRRFYNFDSVMAELQKGNAVELSVWNKDKTTGKTFYGHTVSVTGISKSEDAYEIDYVHDCEQDDRKSGTEGIWTTTYQAKQRIFVGGDPMMNGSKYYYFIVEIPKEAENNSSTPIPIIPSQKRQVGADSITIITDPSSNRLNTISIYELKNDQFVEDVIFENEPVYITKQTPMSTVSIPAGILKSEKKYCFVASSQQITGNPCGISHPVEFITTTETPKWITGFLDGAITDGTVDFTAFDSKTSKQRYKINNDIFESFHEFWLSDYKGFARIYVNPNGIIYDWFALPWMKNEAESFQAFPIHIDSVFEGDDTSYFRGSDTNGIRKIFEYNPKKHFGIRKNSNYIVSGNRLWWENEFTLEKIKPNINPNFESRWINCEINSYEDGILYVQLPTGDASFDFFAKATDANNENIEGYTGCAEILVVADTVINWNAKPQQSVCGFISNINFYQLNLEIDNINKNNSNWFQAEFFSTGYRKPLFLNLSVNSSWVVQNMLIPPMYKGPLNFSFGLENIGGNRINSVLYGYSLTPNIRYTKPVSTRNANVLGRDIIINLDNKISLENIKELSPPTASILGTRIKNSATLGDFSIQNYDTRESIPGIVSSSLNYLYETNNLYLYRKRFDTGAMKIATQWNKDTGCRLNDGEAFEELSWWKTLKKHFVTEKLPFQINRLSELDQIISELKTGNPILLNASRNNEHYTVSITSAFETETGDFIFDITHDTNQSNPEAGIITERITIDSKMETITGGIWINGCKKFQFYSLQSLTKKRPNISLTKPTNTSNVLTPYPTFQWNFEEQNISTVYSFYLYKISSGQTVSDSTKGKPVFSTHGIINNSFKFPKNQLPLERNTQYIWFVESYEPARLIVARSPIFTFSFSPLECEDIRGEILSGGIDPNSGSVFIEFRQCAVSKAFIVKSRKNIYDNQNQSKIIGFKGCATVCVVRTDDGLYLDSWQIIEGDCCIDEPCSVVRGIIIKVVETTTQYPILVEFRPCGETKTELVANTDIPDMSTGKSLLNYTGCAEVCYLDSGLIQSWTAIPDSEKCCDEICNNLYISWATSDGFPPVILTCPGRTHNLENIIRLKNDCKEDNIEARITISSSWGGLLSYDTKTINPRNVVTQSVSFISPESFPAELTINIEYNNIQKDYIIPILGLTDCDKCCDIQTNWTDSTITKYGSPPKILACEDDETELEFKIVNNCKLETKGRIFLERRGKNIDYIKVSKQTYTLDSHEEKIITFKIQLDKTNLASKDWRVVTESECGEKEKLDFKITQKRDCKKEITTKIQVLEMDCVDGLIETVDLNTGGKWTLKVKKTECNKFQPGTCWLITGEEISKNKIEVEKSEQIDCF